MKKIFCVVAVFPMLFLVSSYAQSNKAIDLKFNLPKGASYDYYMDVDMNLKGDAAGQAVDVTNKIGAGYLFKALDDSSGWKKMSATISRFSMNVNAGGVNINFDSDKPADTTDMINSMVGKVLGTMKGSEFTFTMSSNGEINNVKGIDEMIERMASSAPGGAGMTSGLGGAFSEEQFRQNMQQAFGSYPGKPVKPGDSWTNTYSTNNSGMEMRMDNAYTLESVSGNTANIKVESKISAANASTPLNGNMKGLMKYDIPTGVPVDGDLNMNLNMNDTEGGQSTPMTIDIRMKITGKKS